MGVLSKRACIAATVNLDGPKVRGPLPIADAWALWMEKEKHAELVKDAPRKRSKVDEPPASASSPFSTPTKPAAATSAARGSARSNATLRIEWPSDAALEDAERLNKRRVFACKVSPQLGRIAFSHDAAAKGASDATVRSVNRYTSLVKNLVAAEDWLLAMSASKNSSGAKKSVAQRLSEARAARTSKGAAVIDLSGSPPSSPDGSSAGASGFGSPVSALSGFTGMVRSRRSRLTEQCFTKGQPIVIKRTGCPSIVEFDEDGDIELPGAMSYHVQRRDTMPSFEDWHREKMSAVKAWPLMEYSEFLLSVSSRLGCVRQSTPMLQGQASKRSKSCGVSRFVSIATCKSCKHWGRDNVVSKCACSLTFSL